MQCEATKGLLLLNLSKLKVLNYRRLMQLCFKLFRVAVTLRLYSKQITYLLIMSRELELQLLKN